MQGVGFEPTKAEPTDLQSVVFDRFTNPAHLTTIVVDEHLPGLYPGSFWHSRITPKRQTIVDYK